MSAVITRGPVSQRTSHRSLETCTEMVKHVLVIPLQVIGQALELCQEHVQALSPVILL